MKVTILKKLTLEPYKIGFLT